MARKTVAQLSEELNSRIDSLEVNACGLADATKSIQDEIAQIVRIINKLVDRVADLSARLDKLEGKK